MELTNNTSIIKDGRHILKVPRLFSVKSMETAKISIDFLDNIDHFTRINEKMLIDLSRLEFFHAPSALLLFAYITNAQITTNRHDIIKVILPVNQAIRSLVRKSGLWDAIKYGTKRKLDRNWELGNNFQSGYDAEEHYDKTFKYLKKQYSNFSKELGVAINEAMLNINQHAYRYHPKGSVTRWWQYAYIKDDTLNFCIFDKGCGIPTSFKKLNFYKNNLDQEIIVNAMKKNTSTMNIIGTEGRGRGSANIIKPVSSVEKDKLLIISEQGLYRYFHDKDIETSRLPLRLNGTLLCWQIKAK